MRNIRISLLHLALKPGLLSYNYRLVENGIYIAAAANADWIITPELCISGYLFRDFIGVGWIKAQPDEWTSRVCMLARKTRRAIWFAHVERGNHGNLYNSVFVINADGLIVGHHRKINTAAESWASSGQIIEPVTFKGYKIGMLICADAYTATVAQTLHAKGAEILVSPAAWAPGLYGPNGEWEQRTIETGLPMIVCNRTGMEKTLSFYEAESLIIRHGQKLMTHRSRVSAVLTLDWDLEEMGPISREFCVSYLRAKLRDEGRGAPCQKQVYKANGGGLPKTETVCPLVPGEPV
jgi:predicted amidohydrolase